MRPARGTTAGRTSRVSEAAHPEAPLDDIYREVEEVEVDLIERITARIVAAGLTFAAEHLDAPRAVREPVTA